MAVVLCILRHLMQVFLCIKIMDFKKATTCFSIIWLKSIDKQKTAKLNGVISMECTIRNWKLQDAAELAMALNNKNIQDNLRDGLPLPYTEDHAREYITAMMQADKNTTFAFAITAKDKIVGSIGVFRKENIHAQTAEMGYYIAEPFWGKGIGTSAVQQTCHYIFHHTNIIRIFAEPFAFNTASCRILEKSGFICEGVLRCNAVKNGRIIDMKLYALIKQ